MTRYQRGTSGYKPIPGIESILFSGNFNPVQAEVDRSLRESLSARPKEGKTGFTGDDIIGTTTANKSRISIADESKLTPVQRAYLKADMYIQQSEWGLAAEALEKVLEISPDESLLNWMNTLLGIAYFELKDFDRAVDAFKKSIEANPDSGAGYLYLGTIHMMKYITSNNHEELKKAVKPFKTAIRLKHHTSKAYFYLGYVFAELKRWQDAEESYQKAIKAQKDFRAAYLSLAKLYSTWALSNKANKQKYLRKAISTFENLAKLESHNSETYNYIGYLYIELDNSEGAINAFKRALEANPKNALAAVNLATACLEAGRYLDARSILKLLAERDEKDLKSYLTKITEETEAKFHLFMDEVYQKLGVACLNLYLSKADEKSEDADPELLEEAKKAFETAISLNPEDAYAYLGLGVVFYRKDEIESAAKHFRKVLEISLDDKDALGNLEALRQHIGKELRNSFGAKLQQSNEGEEVTTEDLIEALSAARTKIFDDETKWEKLGIFGSHDLLEVLLPFADKSATPEGRRELAIKLYVRKWLSFDDSVRLAGLDREIFIEYLHYHNIQIHDPEVAYLPPHDANAAVALLQSWYKDDPQEQKETWEFLKVALDEDRLSSRKLFS
jgi:tetratricopeptide (TPR) repeat protein